MKLISILLIFSFFFSFGQEYKNVEELTKQLFEQNDNDSIKTLKICQWITDNIEFNTKAFKEQKLLTNQEIITKRIATNQGYSNLLAEMLSIAKIKNAKITGYYKGIFFEEKDIFLKANHIWNAVFIDDKWLLFDITLASGYLVNTNPTNADLQKLKAVKSFNKEMLFVNPLIFRRTHLPLQKYWQLSDRPITIKEFEQSVNLAKDKTKYDFISNINKNYNNKPTLNQELKLLSQGYQENERNVLLLALKNKKIALNEFKQLKRGNVAEEIEYKKIITKIAKYCKQTSMQYGTYIRNVKQETRKKITKSRTFNISNLKELNENEREIKRDITERNKTINQLNIKEKKFTDLFESYKKKIIEEENKTVATETELSKSPKLDKIHKDLNVILSFIKDIQTDTIKQRIEIIKTIEDSINTLIIHRLEYEKRKSKFLNNFAWNNIDVYNKINDTITETSRKTQEQIILFKTKIDTSYFNVINNVKQMVQDAENKYNLMTGEKMSDNIFALFNKTMNEVYSSANSILLANIDLLKNINKYISKDYENNNKKLLDEINEQLKSENNRLNNMENYYNELMKQETELYNSAIEKCNTRITKPFNKYQKEGIEDLDIINFIFVE